jgi:mono/diheme cytochrome c family protein
MTSERPPIPVWTAPSPEPQPAAPAPDWAFLPLEPMDGTGAASAGAVALARVGERTVALVADADEGVLHTFDVDQRALLASTPLGARPSAVLVAANGRVAVLGADDSRVHLLRMAAVDQPLVTEGAIDVPAEPVSAALVPGGDRMLVASRWGHALSIVRLAEGVIEATIALPRDPAAAVASSDGRRAFVVHAAGSRMSIVDLTAGSAASISLDRKVQRGVRVMFPPDVQMRIDFEVTAPQFDESGGAPQSPPKPRRPDLRNPLRPVPVPVTVRTETVTLHADQGFAMTRGPEGRILAPDVAVDTGAEALSSGYGDAEAAATPAILSFDENRAVNPEGKRIFGSRCLLPRGAALDSHGGTMLVACLGSDEVALLGFGPRGAMRRRSVRVPRGPVAVAIDERNHRAIVWSAFDRMVSVIATDLEPKLLDKTRIGRMSPAPEKAVLRGRVLFHAVSDPRISADGRACASCHPDARDDGLSWSSPGGRRQTPMLVERLDGTAPYGWDGAAKDFTHHLMHTTARLGGFGLGRRDVADLQSYIASLRVPSASRIGDDAQIARGDVIFHSRDTGCAGCHGGHASMDGETHDVESARRGELKHAFDTPSLHLVAHSAPYFHDGRFSTLAKLLAGSDGAMGTTSQLSSEDRDALVAYLETL